jgi:hypothetical protein
MGRTRQYCTAMDAAINGVTTVRVVRGGTVLVSGGPDMAVIRSALREPPVRKEDVR